MAVKEIERLVVVVDIRAWLLHPNPTKLALLLQQSVHTFLASMSPACRWGFKLFDSSLSPFSSRCKINKVLGSWACSTRFDSVLPGGDNSPTLPEVLSQFCSALNCLHTELHKNLAASASAANGTSVAAANAGFIASSLLELLADCTWNPLLPSHEDAATTSQYDHLLAPIQFNSNLVIFFSTLPSTHTELVHFLGHESVAPAPDLLATFTSSFKKVRESFFANNIHLCWIDVPVSVSTLDHDKEIIYNGGAFYKSPLISLLDHLGWSFTSLDVLLTGLRMVPFSVLWQGLAHPWSHFCRGPASGAYKVSVQIRDVSNKPMNTTLCKVETISLCNKQLESFTHGNALRITSTIPRKFFNCARQLVSAQMLLRPKAAGKGKLDGFEIMLGDEHDRNFVGDYVLRQLQQEGCAFEPGKPVWQLLMLHLAREERLAIMDVGGSDSTCFALLDPLTVHLALLSIVDKVCFSESLGCLSKVRSYEKSLAVLSAVEESRSDTDSSWSVPVEIPCQEIGICKGAHNYDEIQPKERMIKPPLKRKPLIPLASAYHQDLNVLDHNALDNRKKRAKPSCSPKPEENLQGAGNMILEELYLRSSKRSKILKVLSCWMKQTKQDLDLVSFSHVNLLSGSAGRYSHVISDVGPDNPLTGNPNLQCREEYKGVAVAPHIDNPSSGDCQPLNNVPDMRRVDTSLDCQPLDDSAVQDTISPPLLAKSASSKGLCHDKEAAACEDLALDDANAFIASLDQKIVDCLSSPEIDLHCFSQRVVVDAQRALSVLLSRGPLSEDHSQNLNTLTELAFEANIVDKMIQILLQNPKKLASKYKKWRTPRSTSQITESELEVSHHIYGSEEKVREHELQILFRMEIISLMLEPSGQNQLVSTLVNEICRLLESIQFNLPGGVLEGESLLDFSNNVIKERYKERLPTIVDDIYMTMEFNGHDDVSEVEELEPSKEPSKAESELIPSGSDAHESWGAEEDSFSNSDNPYTSSSQGKWKDHSRDLSLQRALFRERSRCAGRDPADQKKLKQAEAKRERAKRFSHFASSSRDLLRVTVTPKVSVCIKRHPKSHGGSTRSKPSKPKKAAENEVILQTPFSSAAKQRSEKPPLAVKKQLLA